MTTGWFIITTTRAIQRRRLRKHYFVRIYLRYVCCAYVFGVPSLDQAFLAHPPTAASAGAVSVTDITEDGLALFGSVVAEVDRWYKRRVLPPASSERNGLTDDLTAGTPRINFSNEPRLGPGRSPLHTMIRLFPTVNTIQPLGTHASTVAVYASTNVPLGSSKQS